MTDLYIEEIRNEIASSYRCPKDMMFGCKISNHDDKELEAYYAIIKKTQYKLSSYNHMYSDKFENWVKNGAKKYKQTIRAKK
jgi:hypothetical protein